jgi:hypothetical protein
MIERARGAPAWNTKTLGRHLKVLDYEREELRIWQLRAIDVSDEEFERRVLAKKAVSEKERRAKKKAAKPDRSPRARKAALLAVISAAPGRRWLTSDLTATIQDLPCFRRPDGKKVRDLPKAVYRALDALIPESRLDHGLQTTAFGSNHRWVCLPVGGTPREIPTPGSRETAMRASRELLHFCREFRVGSHSMAGKNAWCSALSEFAKDVATRSISSVARKGRTPGHSVPKGDPNRHLERARPSGGAPRRDYSIPGILCAHPSATSEDLSLSLARHEGERHGW